MSYKVVIPTAGIGSRLEKLTKNINKSLISVANRPILSHVIDQFPKTCKFVILLGYKGLLVKDFLKLAYPERTFYFVNVDKYKGKGSGLGYSLLCCESYLQEPFVFTSCDTLVKNQIQPPNFNWMGSALVKDLSLYRTLKLKKKYVLNIDEKKKINIKNKRAYIGLAGVNDYPSFWKAMKNGRNKAIIQGEVYGLSEILKKNKIKSLEFNWFDTGNPKELIKTRLEFKKKNEPNILEKENEAIWFLNNKVIKFSTDIKFIDRRIKRANKLKGFVPIINNHNKNMYCYNKIKGDVLSDIIDPKLFKIFLIHSQNFWRRKNLKTSQYKIFKKKCYDFYHNKTKERISLFYKIFNKQDRTESINGEEMPTTSNLLKKVNWKELSNGLAGRFHGDFHFENILFNPKKKKFTFLDWRQDFGDNLEVGDIYYDLAKLLHGMIVSHKLIAKKKFDINWKENKITFDLKRKKSLELCEKLFDKWCDKHDFSYKKIRILTALIFLNIAALHHYPYSLFLYALGKHMLKTELDK